MSPVKNIHIDRLRTAYYQTIMVASSAGEHKRMCAKKTNGDATTEAPAVPLASFYTPDPNVGQRSSATQDHNTFVGEERRRDNRRKRKERRSAVRFDTDEGDRRQRSGRRVDDASKQYCFFVIFFSFQGRK